MVSQGKNKLIQKYSSDFSYYFNNPELSDIIIQVSENGFLDQDFNFYKPTPIKLMGDRKPTITEIIEITKQNNNCIDKNNSNNLKNKNENNSNNDLDYFYTHKFVLSARSPVFMKMLSCQMMESNSYIITSHFPKNIFYIVLKFLYSGKVEMNASNVLDVLAAADYYQLEDLKDFCGKFSLQTCIDGELDICRVLHAAEQYGLEKIKTLCLDYISQHSMDILLSSPNWHLLTEENLISILEQDNLRVPEVEIFDSLVRWAEKQYLILKDISPVEIVKEDFLKKKLSRPLKSIRFASMFPHQLSNHIEASGIVDREILFDAYKYCAAHVPTKNPSSCELRQGVKEFTFQYNGDTNGVLYYFGTLEDMDDYESPATRKIVTVTSSSMSIGYPHPFVSRTSTNMYTDKEENSFFCVDLGAKHVLCPTYYSMRYGGDSQGSIYAAPKNWQLLGSLDGIEWSILCDHKNDMSLKEGYSIAGWEVKSIHSYRYLKILQTGPNQRDGHELCVCCFEVYGRLVNLEDNGNGSSCSIISDDEDEKIRNLDDDTEEDNDDDDDSVEEDITDMEEDNTETDSILSNSN
ncbi:hypothetical protein DICPUDRAFT_51693 [Dictyostelium purpureum]|uniref:BTB domain-containing protein n=1 Tax=Dictyostelium purpureum TaxID=5786 RepID=F1A509_DICPU|nr:uncharacterized protein DICPUDRAFT_51693 [Dictyostelium purpureum]EGC28716.1 hypothetical protein DICPUDRAFT_51693 [Dictyostelium purpureum]|eukprot:XP_003294753.1 hypothetical protein DICPUDRAFT_51693 [Dictyostelium purpureum]